MVIHDTLYFKEAIKLIYAEGMHASDTPETNNIRIGQRIMSECYQLPTVLTSYFLSAMSSVLHDHSIQCLSVEP